MAWMIPIITSNRRRGRSGLGGMIAGLMMLLIFGILFFILIARSGIFMFDFPKIFIIFGFIVFVMVIFGISIAASSMSKTYKPVKSINFEQNQTNAQAQTYQQNPYIARKPNSENLEIENRENLTIVVSEVREVNFCRYCGTNIESEARFCHECGSKL